MKLIDEIDHEKQQDNNTFMNENYYEISSSFFDLCFLVRGPTQKIFKNNKK